MMLFNLQFYLLLFVFIVTPAEQASGVLTSQDRNNTHPCFPSAMLAGYCPSRCGNLTFEYPFGIGSGCYRDPDFSLTCDDTMHPPRLYLQDTTTEVIDGIDASTYGRTSFMNFSVQIPSYAIPIRQGVVVYDMSWKAPAFILDHAVLNITGCDFDAYWVDQPTTTWKLCTVTCPDARITDKVARQNCNGTGCCSIEFNTYLRAIQLKFVVNSSRELTTHSALRDSINVTYASASISWSIMDRPTCASALDNTTNYACVSNNSKCYDSHFASYPGYHCGCEGGYGGNPYIPNGCSRDKGYNPIIQKVNCRRSCGNITVPFPFGLEEGCSARKLFQLKCTNARSSTLQFDDKHQVTYINVGEGLLGIKYASHYIQQTFGMHEPKEPGLYIGSGESSSVQWAVANLTCHEAQKNSSGYGCVSNHSVCLGVNSTDGYIGYRCKCVPGFHGNPYISNGCEDIDECLDPGICRGVCNNAMGSYYCISCPYKTLYDPTTRICTPMKKVNIVLPGVSIGIVVLVVTLSCAYLFHQKRSLAAVKKRYFKQHGGLLLLEEMKSKQGLSFTLFTKIELEEATDNFDERNVLGKGGNGTVYKGSLKDSSSVAIKKCKLISERQEEFGKEMLILSQINHRNVVKLYGCCLEVEVPMLVYEFIPNGTLYQLIHGRQRHGPRVSFATRLKIAHEAAEALAYLHSWASPPIIHGDVKSANILIDYDYTVKVSDFGASTLAPTDEAQFVTFVQGTYGYLDPEYMLTSKLTSKSDVYSFGVVLLELLTCRKATNLQAVDEEINLSAHFLLAVSENRLGEVLDEQIKGEESIELIEQVAELAKRCLEMASEKRPPMREVADELHRFRKLSQHPWGQETSDEELRALLVGSPNAGFEIELSNGYLSMTDSAYLGIQSPR